MGIEAFARDRRGHAGIIVALFGGVLCAVLALVIDLGSIALKARQLQGAADLAALSAARDRDRAVLAARATAQGNLGPAVTVAVTPGRYRADRAVAPDARFTPDPVQANAVRVTLSDEAPLYFGRWILGRDSVPLSRTATAAVAQEPPRAMFSIGSRLARLDGGIANAVLGGLTGSQVSLSVMDYEALADADVSLLGFSDALATELGLEAGDYDGLLEREIAAGRALRVLEAVAGPQAGSGLSRLADAAGDVTVRLSDLIGVEAGAEDGLAGPLDVSLSALDVATALLEVGAGDRQVALDLGARAGLADVDVSLAIGERPNHSSWITVTSKGTPVVRTAQARLYLKARTAQKLSGLAQVNLPILIELAGSEARLNAIVCDPHRAVELGVKPGLAKATIGAIDERRLADFKQPLVPARATMLSVLGLVSITGRAEIAAADQGFTPLSFSDAEITDQTVKTVQSRGLANGVVVSLLQRLDLDVNVVGLGLGLGGLANALGQLLAPLGPVLDGLINPILDTLGLKFGEADLVVHNATCPVDDPRPQLVG